MDPHDFIDMLDFILGGMGEGFNINQGQAAQLFGPPDTTEDFIRAAGDTANRINSYVPEQAGSSINQLYEPMHDTVAAPYMRPSPQNPTQFQKFVGGMGIGDLSTRLSGEGNLGLLLTSLTMDRMAQNGDPMASYLRYLSGANAQQM